MKKYDFSKEDLWFSRRALQELACSERKSFYRVIKKIERSAIKEDGTTFWKQDEMYLPRIEGGRKVYRKDVVYDLDTSYYIMSNYSRATPPDYWMILERLEELCEIRTKGKFDELKAKGVLSDSFMMNGELDKELLEIIDDSDDEQKKKVFLSFSNDSFELVSGESEEEGERLWPRSMFRLASDGLLSL